MSFGNAGALGWLIPLVGALIALYLLKMRRRDLKVPASFLWPAMTYEVRANSLFQKLRFSWLLVLQVLAVCIVVVALARPQIRQKGLVGEVTVVVIDTSASMSSTDVKPSRFEVAMETLRTIVDSAKPGDRLSVIEAGAIPRVVFPLSNDQAKMRFSIRTIEPTDSECDIGEAMRLAASLTSKESGARILLLSDGVFFPITNFSPGRAKVDFKMIGISRENVAITALGASDTGTGPQLFINLKNYGLRESQGMLKLTADGKLINSLKVTVPAQGAYSKTFQLPDRPTVVEASLDNSDSLSADNYAVTVDDPGAQVHVLLLGKGDIFLEKALALDPRVTLDKAVEAPKTGTAYDVVVFDGMSEIDTGAKGVLTFGASGPTSSVIRTGTTTNPTLVSQDHDDLILNSVDLRNTFIERSEQVQVKADGKVLALSSGGPMVVSSKGKIRRIYVSFQPLKSDFPLQVGFPIFISNALDFLAPRESLSSALRIEVGRPFSLPATDESRDMLVSGPNQKMAIKATAGSYIVRDVTRVGKYELSGAHKQTVFATLNSEIESNIKPQEQVLLGGTKVVAQTEVQRFGDYWRPLLMVALLVLAGEWWLYARRS